MSNEKYISGYQNVSPDWLKPLVDDFEATENKMFVDKVEAKCLAAITIPIYTGINPHPERNKADCLNTRMIKKGLRVFMEKELKAVQSEEERNLVIAKYALKASQIYG